ncbi:MAG: hypothetical protein A3J74_04795 [Elusimicrobia bacterium RIFCSPHIGHO2_02_FULL_57_9]|nr:MAG: hypothetical protein A3J74_04795 [Elusimicrobia bacterium RIFCSPHIGHO2_02_FULL_57_9]
MAEGAHALLRLALEAARQAGTEKSRLVRCKDASGDLPLPSPTLAAATASSPSLSARYQQLTLLNRMSLELFSEKPFAQSLQAACTIILAVTGAAHATVYFRDDLGKLFSASRQGGPRFCESDAQKEEAAAAASAGSQRRLLHINGAQLSWSAAPFLRIGRDGWSDEGVLIIGFEGPQAANAERDKILLEISLQLRNAGLIHKNMERQSTLAVVTEQSADAILITDLESRIVNWNRSAEQLFQYRREEILGQPLARLTPDDKRDEHQNLEKTVLALGSIQSIDTLMRKKDGSLVPVEGSYALLRDEKGAPFGVVRVFRDITKRKEIDRMKSDFIAMVTHELRTPLTAILGFAETLRDMGNQLSPEEVKNCLGVMFDESKRLTQLVNNYLDISKIEAGSVHLNLSRVEITALTQRLSALFRGNPLGVVLWSKFAAGIAVRADADQLYRVLVNLCANAIKYSPAKGTVAIAAVLREGLVEISVADQGQGIAKNQQGKLFEKFYRSDDDISRKTPGTGLGLSIAKAIVSAHGGRIWVESEPGDGAKFLFTLPAA